MLPNRSNTVTRYLNLSPLFILAKISYIMSYRFPSTHLRGFFYRMT